MHSGQYRKTVSLYISSVRLISVICSSRASFFPVRLSFSNKPFLLFTPLPFRNMSFMTCYRRWLVLAIQMLRFFMLSLYDDHFSSARLYQIKAHSRASLIIQVETWFIYFDHRVVGYAAGSLQRVAYSWWWYTYIRRVLEAAIANAIIYRRSSRSVGSCPRIRTW